MRTLRFLLLFCPIPLLAQTWPLLQQIDGDGQENVAALLPLPGGATVAAGTYSGSSPFAEGTPSQGKADLFIARYDENGAVEWWLEGGASENEEVAGIAQLPGGDLVIGGSYWFELSLGDTILGTGSSIRSLFLSRVTPQGQTVWAQRISGDGLKDIANVAVLPDTSLLVAGFFKNTLELGDSLITTAAAPGSTSLFLAAFSPQGTLRWVTQAGGEGDLRITAMATAPDGQIAVGGTFDGIATLAGTTLDAGFFNQDVFLAAFSPQGEALWARDLGGIIEDNLKGIAVDSLGNIYATGNIIGVMNLSETLSIESSNGNDDFFLVKYAPDGTPLWGRALGGPDVQNGNAVVVRDGFVIVGGGFQGLIGWDGLSADVGTDDVIWGFAAGFTPDGAARWLRTIPTNDLGLINTLAFTPGRQLLAGGTFGQTGSFNGSNRSSAGDLSGFWGRMADLLTPVPPAPSPNARPVTAFPNPTTGRVYLDPLPRGSQPLLFDAAGRRLPIAPDAAGALDLSGLPNGWYLIAVPGESGSYTRLPVLKAR